MRNHRTTRRRTFSVSVARSAWVISRAGGWLQPAALPSHRRQESRRPVTGRREDAVGRSRLAGARTVAEVPKLGGAITIAFVRMVLWATGRRWSSRDR